MKKQEIDHILARMLDAFDNVSDLNITDGKTVSGGKLGAADSGGDRSAL